jgi:O-antigen/teichoic acid export membrane protein
MKTRERLILVKNALANVIRGSAAALVALFLPPFLTRLMLPDAFGAWSLVLQLSAFVGYLDFGIQTSVGRFVAHASESGDTEHRNRIVNTSLAALTLAGALGIGGCLGLAALLPRIFHQIPAVILHDSRWALVLVGSSLAIGLPCSVFNGIFVGLQRYEIPAAVIGGSRLVSAALLVLIVKEGGTLIAMATAVATVNLFSYVLQYLIYRQFAPRVHFARALICRKAGHELFDYCLSLSIWSFATLLVTGLDIALVGFFDFGSVAYYTAAATLITFILGLQNALFTAMIPASAVLEARSDTQELGRILLSTSRYGMFILLASGLPLLLATKPLLSFWVGAEYAAHAGRILQVLVVANVIRLSAVPYAMLLIGTGQQRLVTVSPLLEGFSNLAVSLIAGALLGAIGIAVGTLVGAIVGILANFVYNLPRSTRISASRFAYLRDGYLRPLVCGSPVFLLFPLRHIFSSDSACAIFLAFLVLALTWAVGFSAGERERIRTWLRFTPALRAGARP